MKMPIRILLAILIIMGFAMERTVEAQTSQRTSDAQIKDLLDRIERSADSFNSSLQDALKETSFSSQRAEDNVGNFIKEFEASTDRLKERYGDKNAATGAVQEVLNRATYINNFMQRYPLTMRAQNEWEYLRTNLNELARVYNVRWVWPGVAATRPYRVTDSQMEAMLERIEQKTDTFRTVLQDALTKTRFTDTAGENNINQFVMDFERATDRLEDVYDDDSMTVGATAEVLRRGVVIDRFLQRNKLTPEAQNAWRNIRSDLDELAKNYSIAMNWNAPSIVIQILVPKGQVSEQRQ